MDWLPELLKNLTVSRSFTGALFIASISVLGLPHLAPEFAEPVPNGWRWLVIGISIFSASLLSFWLFSALWEQLAKVPKKVRGAIPVRPLTDFENSFLLFLGTDYPNDSLDIDNLNHQKTSKLELLQMCKDLEALELVRINPFNDNLVSLTESGRIKALLLARQAKT